MARERPRRRLRLAALLAVLLLGTALVPAAARAGDDVPPPAPAPPAGEEPKAEPAISAEALRPIVRAVAALLRTYLEDKADPAKAKVWDEFLRDIVKDLEAVPDASPAEGVGGFAGRLAARALQGFSDPERKEVMGRILSAMLGAAQPKPAAEKPAAEKPAGRAPTAGESSDDPLVAGGAHLHLVARTGGALALEVQALDEGSVAAQLGLATGDAIVEVGGAPVGMDSPAALKRGLSRPGELALTVDRQGKRIAFDVEVAPPPR